jgi:hypothetical protein
MTEQSDLQAAQNLWSGWSGIHSPKSPDDAILRIVDGNGNEVGGSGALGGSVIWVQGQP